MKSLYEQFHEHFEVIRVNNPQHLTEALKIRYQVYCLEQKYEDPQHFPQGLESDTFDHHADHSIIRHKVTNQTLGAVRLVVSKNALKQSFPIEQHFQGKYDGLLDKLAVDRKYIGEVSRFAISNQFRRVIESNSCTTHIFKQGKLGDRRNLNNRVLYSNTVAGLINAVIRMSLDHNLTHWVCLMEPSLARLLGRFGFEFKLLRIEEVGNDSRKPYFAVINEELERIYHSNSEVWEMITDQGKLWGQPVSSPLIHIA